MGRYDEEIIELVRTTDLTDSEVARRVGVSRPTVWAAKKKAGLVTPKPDFEIRVLDIIPRTEHQSQYAYIMLKRLERQMNLGDLPEKSLGELKSFISGLEKKVWIYEPEAGGFRQIPRTEVHGNKPFYNE
jgi:hypothetical protein